MAFTFINFDSFEQNNKAYGGMAGAKVGVTDTNGIDWMLKYQKNIDFIKTTSLHYSNSPLSEYMGSHVYDIIGLDAHQTFLGERNGRMVVACQDFTSEQLEFIPFSEIQATSDLKFGEGGEEFIGQDVSLKRCLEAIEKSPFLSCIPNVEDRFWDMFVVDMLIGNADRNNGNWGILQDYDTGKKMLAPIFDCGGAFNCNWDNQKMQNTLDDPNAIYEETWKRKICVYLDDRAHHIHPAKFIEDMQYEGCNMAIMRNVPEITKNWDKIQEMINEITFLSDIQRRFHITIMSTRLEQTLIPTYDKCVEKYKDKEENIEENLSL